MQELTQILGQMGPGQMDAFVSICPLSICLVVSIVCPLSEQMRPFVRGPFVQKPWHMELGEQLERLPHNLRCEINSCSFQTQSLCTKVIYNIAKAFF